MNDDQVKTTLTKKEKADLGSIVLQAINQADNKKSKNSPTFFIVVGLFIATLIISSTFFIKTINSMHNTYIKETEKIIKTKSDIDLANQWERLPVNQRKERLRSQFFEIVRYYTNNIPEEQKMSDDQLLNTFNQLWLCIQKKPYINFFLPIAYMKVKTNFNPVYNIKYQRGIIGFYLKMAERVSNLPIIRDDDVFKVVYKGTTTLNNPPEAIKLLVARIDDLMQTFNNREDWVLLSLFENEYTVISKYWDDGKGEIPDKFYKEGKVAEALRYYEAFKNWQIPATIQKLK